MGNFTLKFKIWLETDDHKGILGDGKCSLLKTIQETGSLNEAMKKHRLTYRKTWDNLNKIEEVLGFHIIKRQRGGNKGGKTELTPQGKAIVEAFDKFHEKYDAMLEQALEDILTGLKKQI